MSHRNYLLRNHRLDSIMNINRNTIVIVSFEDLDDNELRQRCVPGGVRLGVGRRGCHPHRRESHVGRQYHCRDSSQPDIPTSR